MMNSKKLFLDKYYIGVLYISCSCCENTNSMTNGLQLLNTARNCIIKILYVLVHMVLWVLYGHVNHL